MTSNPRVMISVEDVDLAYQKGRSLFRKRTKQVFKGLSFQVCEGDSLGLVGRNGAGKSTLLRLLAGVIAPDKGKVRREGVSSALLALGVGFNHQLDGKINVLLNGMLLGFSKREVESKLSEIIEFSELGEAINDPVKTYSAGMRARLAFAVAINLRPDVLLIDEALGVGDASFLNKSGQALRERVKSNQTVVLVSHNGETIMDLCNRAIWIEDGVLQKEGEAEEVVAEYEKYITSSPLVI
jgi:lipopolysaccharide transport system ATP-binding protein